MSKNKKIILTISLTIMIALSFLLFLGIGKVEKTNEQILRFTFIIVNEILIYGTILWSTRKKCNAFTNAGIISAMVIYTIISLLFNLIFISVFTTVKNILVFNFSILLVFAFIATIVIFAKKENIKDGTKE